MWACLVSQANASLLQRRQEELQEKVSNLDVRPQSLAGRAADDAGDCPHMTFANSVPTAWFYTT